MNRTLTELGSKIVSLKFVYPPSPSPLLHFEIHCHFILPSPRVLEKYYSMVFTSVSHRLRKTCKTWKREIFSKFRVFVENVLCLQCRCKLRYRKVPKVTLRTTLGLSGLLLPPDPIAPFGRLLVYGDRYFRVAKTCLVYCQGHPTAIFGKISVRKTIWDLEFSEYLL